MRTTLSALKLPASTSTVGIADSITYDGSRKISACFSNCQPFRLRIHLQGFRNISKNPKPKTEMSRTPFIIGTALLCVTATIVTFRVMPSSESPEEALLAAADELHSASTRNSSPAPSTSSSTFRNNRPADQAAGMDLSLETSALARLAVDKRPQVNGILSGIRKKSVEKLDQFSEAYALTRKQRAAIYPLIVAHDTQAHPAMLIGGQLLPTIPPGQTLDESIYEKLTPDQRDLLTGETLEHDAWWTEVASQLHDDLDLSLSDSGLLAPPSLKDTSSVPGIVPSSGPAQGDGEASDHSGGNLFDLLNGN